MIPEDRKAHMAALRARRQEAARRCYHSYKKRQRHTCPGCDWGTHCRMGQDQAKWLAGWLGEIDPGHNITVVRLGPLGE